MVVLLKLSSYCICTRVARCVRMPSHQVQHEQQPTTTTYTKRETGEMESSLSYATVVTGQTYIILTCNICTSIKKEDTENILNILKISYTTAPVFLVRLEWNSLTSHLRASLALNNFSFLCCKASCRTMFVRVVRSGINLTLMVQAQSDRGVIKHQRKCQQLPW